MKFNAERTIKRLLLLFRGFIMFKDWPLWLSHRFRLLKKSGIGMFRMRNGARFILDFSRNNPGTFQEVWLMDLYEKNYAIKNGDTVIDIGASIGAFSVLAARKGAFVYAYEPTPRSFELLKQNVVPYNNVKIFNLAVSGGKKVVTLEEAPGGDEGNTVMDSGSGRPRFSVSAIALVDIFKENSIRRCDLLKIDCEGAEVEILERALQETFERIENIAMEYHKNAERLINLLGPNYLISKTGDRDNGYIYARKK
ncbi:MAG: hypothetical protein A3B25_02175 [Candidatus Ryanbacteria bacterium RIFCSPLOWO2_01_FULL_48_26]|uniref:Methyltransferase FkbM domain-containing protein n=1 Tax=Candidatus Ryanbacteria bacterium RIFCSPLOWO2_01_FULL_48_26 TaxID=1802126 RepID=A0A1G2GT87_9BACT|nr:MAG: hypothetical protein A3B25_02175 [Candidatus Ryanbacteria bacterium RIFCSPLOWO2_01_FULL_48_26]